MAHINVLSKEISELIAAGEVIDRPASVIKELLENSIDAGANVITVEIKNGGRTYMRVSDNGYGISRQDVPKAFLRHATSKISSASDLGGILTLGFRGEALASVCAVAKVELLTKIREDAYGTHYVIEGGEEKLNESSGCPDGTTFVVRDLFYNVPARLKFLKKDTSEGNSVSGLVTKIALSHPEISFKFIRDNKVELLTAGDGRLYSAVYSVFGRDFASSLIPVEHTWNGVHVFGYTVKPLSAKNNRKFQNFFVNGRYIRSMTCCGAVEEAYRNCIMTGRFPACVIGVETLPGIVDVNVHPTKIEVRFSDDKVIYEAIYFAVRNALMKLDTPVELDMSRTALSGQDYRAAPPVRDKQMKFSVTAQTDEIRPEKLSPPQKKAAAPLRKEPDNVKENTADDDTDTAAVAKAKENVNVNAASPDADTSQKAEDTAQTAVYDTDGSECSDKGNDREKVDDSAVTQQIMEEIADFQFISQQSFERRTQVVEEDKETEQPQEPVVIGELFKTYIVAQQGEDMLLFDKHASHERYIFEKIKNNADELESQMFLEPVPVLLSYDEYDALAQNVDKAAVLGFDIEPDLAPTVAVKGVPIILGDENPSDIVSQLARNFLECKHNPQLEIFDELYHSVACKAAIKANDDSSLVELQALVNMIWDRDDVRYCPHGRPVMVRLSKKDIEKQFRRIV